MWQKIFDYPDPHTCLIIIAKTAVVYLFLIGGLRLLGKRELGQMNIYDLVMIVVLGNAVQNAMIDNDNSLAGGIISAVTLLLLNRAFNLFILRSPRVARAMVGDPRIILKNGHLLEDQMKREGITRDQVMAALREHGFDKISEANMAVLEVDGTISVVPKGAQVYRTRRHYRALRLP